jgi:hypothetical protein
VPPLQDTGIGARRLAGRRAPQTFEDHVLRTFWLMILGSAALLAGLSQAAGDPEDHRKVLAGELAGVYRFDYLFSEGGMPYVDISGHLQLLELDRDGDAPRVTFFNQTGKGERRLPEVFSARWLLLGN